MMRDEGLSYIYGRTPSQPSYTSGDTVMPERGHIGPPFSPRPERIVPPTQQVDVTPNTSWITTEETREGRMTKKPHPEPTRATKIIGWCFLGPVLAVALVGTLAGAVKAIEWLIGWVF